MSIRSLTPVYTREASAATLGAQRMGHATYARYAIKWNWGSSGSCYQME